MGKEASVTRLLALGFVLVLVCAACTSSSAGTTTSVAPATTAPSAPPATEPPAPTAATPATTSPGATGAVSAVYRQPRAVDAFASFDEIPLLGDAPAYAGPPTPTSADDLLIAPIIRETLAADPAAMAVLLTNGFVITDEAFGHFHHAYDVGLYQDVPLFVTTDAAYHVWHLAFSKVLREAEQQALLPVLEELVGGLRAAATDQRGELAGTELEEPASRVEQWFEAAADLLELAPATSPGAVAEVELARAAAEMTASPLTSFGDCNITVSPSGCVDYTQFKPRGHYTRTADLERYFRAMSLLGQGGFFVTEPPSLRLGLLAARLLANDPELADRWRLIYEPTAFLVGLADDYTPFELAEVAGDLAPGGFEDPMVFADGDLIVSIGEELLARRSVGINPEAAAVRLMGARFVIDSFILDQLAWPNVGEAPDAQRVMVSPLDVAAAFGSSFAYEIQDAAGETAYLRYDEQLDAMRALIGGGTIGEWAATVYDAWLYALQPMWLPHGAAFPDFMRTPAWSAKAHQTGLASYTELKHDTLLYAKQGFAAQGGGDPPAFEPRHWVEPDPVVYARLSAAAGLLQRGLRDRALLPGDLDTLLDQVRQFLGRLERIARDELAGRPISQEDNDWLQLIGPELEALWVASSDLDATGEAPVASDEEAALVADIFRSTFGILELGTGGITPMYVMVPNDAGQFQIAYGATYSYYEFWVPESEGRLTDEEWRQRLRDGELPDRPAWQSVFLAGAETAVVPDTDLFNDAPGGLFCRDLAAMGFDYALAHDYWEWDGSPDRMDADRNGIPCETVYPPEEVAAFFDD